MEGLSKGTRYRFGEFTLSPGRRVLLRGDSQVPLIPKYFDLLCLFVERRNEVLDKQVIFDRIWPDVIVSDSALTQAIRTLRRALGDSPRTPRYIRTLSRRGYQFVFEPMSTEDEDASERVASPRADGPDGEDLDLLVARLLGSGDFAALSDDDRLDAATRLHALGTRQALARIEGKPGAARARAFLRESRWNVPDAGEVPLVGAGGSAGAVVALVALRLNSAVRTVSGRLGAAAVGGWTAGLVAGAAGGLALYVPTDSSATASTISALMIIGGLAGAFGAAIIGAALAAAEVLARSQRRTALVACGTVGGIAAGLMAHIAVEAVFASLLGRGPAVLGGPFEGGVVGCAAAIGYAFSSHAPRGGGMATPRGLSRLRVGIWTALCCALCTAVLGGLGRGTVSVTLDALSLTYDGSQVGLAPLAPFLGERDHRPVTQAAASGFEGLLFGLGLAIGLTHRPSASNSR